MDIHHPRDEPRERERVSERRDCDGHLTQEWLPTNEHGMQKTRHGGILALAGPLPQIVAVTFACQASPATAGNFNCSPPGPAISSQAEGAATDPRCGTLIPSADHPDPLAATSQSGGGSAQEPSVLGRIGQMGPALGGRVSEVPCECDAEASPAAVSRRSPLLRVTVAAGIERPG